MSMIKLIYATAPLLYSSFLAAVLADDYEEFDLPTTFTIIYFLYVLIFSRPRFIYHLEPVKVGSKFQGELRKNLLLSKLIILSQYSTPIFMSFYLQFALHHNVLSTERSRINSVIQSVLLPMILMGYC